MVEQLRDHGAAVTAGVEAVAAERARIEALESAMPKAQRRLLLHTVAIAAVEPLGGGRPAAMAACCLEGWAAGARARVAWPALATDAPSLLTDGRPCL